MTGYEGAMGYTLYDMESETAKTYRITSECSSTGLIRYDTGLLEVNTHLYNQENQTAECKTLYLDFGQGKLGRVFLKNPAKQAISGCLTIAMSAETMLLLSPINGMGVITRTICFT